MNIQIAKTPIGLEGVPAAETVLSHVDGERGELIIAGERVGDLALKTGFEGVTARLCGGRNRPTKGGGRGPVERRHRPADRRGCGPRSPRRRARTRLCAAAGTPGNYAGSVDHRRL